MVTTDGGEAKGELRSFWTSGTTRHNSRFPFLPFLSFLLLMVQLYRLTVDLLFLRGRFGLLVEGESERGHADLLLFWNEREKGARGIGVFVIHSGRATRMGCSLFFRPLIANVLNRRYYTKERERIADTKRKRKGDALFALERNVHRPFEGGFFSTGFF